MEECRAENCKGKHPHKRFCLRGHDTFEVGRAGNKQCRECNCEWYRERYATDPEYRERRRERNRSRLRERWATDPKYRALKTIKEARRLIRHRREVTIEQIKETTSELLADD